MIQKPLFPSVTIAFSLPLAPSLCPPPLHVPTPPAPAPRLVLCVAIRGKNGRGTVKVQVVGATDISHCDHNTRKECSLSKAGDLCMGAFCAFSPLHDQITSTCQQRRINPEEVSPSGGSLQSHSRGRKKNDFTPVCKCAH